MYCSRCGNSIESNVQFCRYCGNKLTPQIPFTTPNPPNLKPHKNPKIYIFAGIGISILVILSFTAASLAKPSYIFSDSSYVKCTEQNYSKDCENIDENEVDELSKISQTDTSDTTEYRDYVLTQFKQKNNEALKKCTNKIAAQSNSTFYNGTASLFVGLCDMDSDYINSSLKILDKLYAIFPNAKGSVNSYAIVKLEENMYGGFQPKQLQISSYFDTIYSDMTMSSRLFTASNINIAKKYYQDDIEKSFHPKNTDYTYVMAHEVAHSIEYMLAVKKTGEKDLLSTDNESDISKMLQLWNNYEISKAIVKEAMTELRKTNPNANELESIMQISEYAASEDKQGRLLYPETLAEAVTDYIANNSRSSPLTLKIIPILSREVEKL